MSLECLVCSDNFAKLKQLACRHAFCTRCLEQIERYGKIRCPYCRQDTELSAFGVDDLRSLFGGQLQCADCRQAEVEMKDGVWCKQCTSIVCKACADVNHKEHDGLDSADRLGPVDFCIQQLDKFSAIHTKLTSIQKQLVREYMQQLGEALERELDDDLTQRLLRLKAEKRHLRKAFDLDKRGMHVTLRSIGGPGAPGGRRDAVAQASGTAASSSASADHDDHSTRHSVCDELLATNSDNFIGILNEIYKISPSTMQARAEFGSLPKDGQIFNPLPLDKTVELFFQPGRFSTFSISMNTLSKRKGMRVPISYLGAGHLDDPCDLCIVADRRLLFVACVNKGLLTLSLDDGELLNHYPPVVEGDQLASVAYDQENRFLLTTVLRRFRDWYVQVYEISTMRLRDEVPCPKTDPRIANSWYRWLTPLSRSRLLVSTGDQNCSVVWLVNLHSRRWTTLNVRAGSTFRKAAFHQPKAKNYKEGLLYVPDMRNKSVVTFILNRGTCELSNVNEIRTEEFTREMPHCVVACGGTLLVGNWNTGNVIVADLVKCASQVLTSVGPKELFSLCYLQEEQKLFVLCKQKELIEVYTI